MLAVALHGVAGNVFTEKQVEQPEHAVTYSMKPQGQINAPESPYLPVAELTNLQSHQISVTRIQRVQIGEYFSSLKCAAMLLQTVIIHCHSIGEGFIILQLPIIASLQVNIMYLL